MSPRDSVRWLVAPSAADAGPITALAGSLRAWDGRGAPTGEVEGWERVSSGPARLVVRHRVGDAWRYAKWFAPDRFSWKRRSGLRWWPTPAARHVAWAGELTGLGVRVVPTVAAGEFPSGGGLIGQAPSFVVTRSPNDARTIESAVREGSLSPDERVALARALVELARRLHARGIGRLDLGPQNVLVYSGDPAPVLFDIDRLVRLGALGRASRVKKDMRRVDASCSLLLAGTGRSFAELGLIGASA